MAREHNGRGSKQDLLLSFPTSSLSCSSTSSSSASSSSSSNLASPASKTTRIDRSHPK